MPFHPLARAFAIGSALMLVAVGCGVSVNQKEGFDPCADHRCEKKGACTGWTAQCSVKDGRAMCGEWKKSDRPELEAPEKYEENETSCDGIDNDCDGLVDEGLVGDPATLCPATGICTGKVPVLACAAGKWRCDWAAVPGFEATETSCDGRDNDCDGLTDEGVTAPAGTCKRAGVCSGLGAPACTDGKWDCAYAEAADYEATEKSCDGKDNDCDGHIDKGLAPSALPGGAACRSEGVCKAGVPIVCASGRPSCDYASIDQYEPFEHTCDTLDNDCDGEVDNIPGTSLALIDTVLTECKLEGVCKGAGVVRRCKAGSMACSYDNVPYYEAVEALCDGRDNDCDGKTDQIAAPPTGICLGGKGVCAEAVPTCNGEFWSCDWAALAEAEGFEAYERTCDGKDNDCDGLTDESASPKVHGCKDKGVCGLGGVTIDCKAGQATCNYSAVPFYSAVTETACDGRDNDCDGLTDHAACAKGQPCADAKACKSGKCNAGRCG